MKLKPSLGFCLLALFAIAGCKKGSAPKPAQKPNTVAQLDTSIDIYILGNSAAKGAILWKNGVETTLSGLPNYNFTGASAMAVNGSDIYIGGSAGASSSDSDPTPVYWKNGVINQFVNRPPHTNVIGIAISGTDVYVSGTVQSNQYAAVYWKNSVINYLAPGVSSDANGGMVVSGTDVYVAGAIADPNTPHGKACYWKNGVLNQITDGSQASFPESIVVQNNNVYVLYNDFPVVNSVTSYVWQNGVATQLSHPSSSSSIIASSMVISGNNIYVTGNTASATTPQTATLWKNNIVQNFPENKTTGGAGAIAIWGNDIYVIGSSSIDGNIVLWKNGIVVRTLSSDLSGIKIAIVPH